MLPYRCAAAVPGGRGPDCGWDSGSGQPRPAGPAGRGGRVEV